MKENSCRGSFLHHHMIRALQAEPSWTPQMYTVYNDLSDETSEELIALWNEPNHGVREADPKSKGD